MMQRPWRPRQAPRLRPGALVRVRSADAILATLDTRGELDGLPFMPEMLAFCGRTMKVAAVALKACDTIGQTNHHRMRNAVHLEEARCDGSGHGGCQAACLLYWKDVWLEPLDQPSPPAEGSSVRCSKDALHAATRRSADEPDGEVYSCQATELLRAAPEELRWWDVRTYLRDVRSGNIGSRPMLRALGVMLVNKFQGFSRRFLPARLRYHGGRMYPFIEGELERTPHELLGLQPGERVRVKSRQAIVATLDTKNRNRGLSFDCEMLRYCGQEVTVRDRVRRIIDEKTGKMLQFDNPCITLEGVTCRGDFHLYCPRAIYPYWREIWLERSP